MAALATKTVVNFSRQNARLLGVVYVNQRHESTGVVRGQTSNLAAYKRGRGGRSSFSGLVTTVFGASGFLGRYVVNKLGKVGSQIVIPYRSDPYWVKDLKLAGDLGQVVFQPYNLDDEESLRKAMKYSNVVINLVGRDYETKCFTLNDVNVTGAARIARIAKEVGVEKFIHMSHLNAQPSPPPIYLKGGSRFLKTKYLGEQAVREEFPEAIIFRPSDIYGPQDRFLNYYSDAWRRARGGVPLWKKGEQTIKMPVFVSDVAEGIINSIHNSESVGQVYEAVGPNSYYLSELVDYMYRIMRHESFKRTYMTPGFFLKVLLRSNFPHSALLSFDKLSWEHVSDKTHYLPTLEDLGVTLMHFEERAPFELKNRRMYASYEERLGEFAEPEPPRAIVY